MPSIDKNIPKPDKRKTKRLCEECNDYHWPFVNCQYGAILNERDEIKEAARQRSLVMPEFRTRNDRVPTDRLRTVRRIGENAFVKAGGRDV